MKLPPVVSWTGEVVLTTPRLLLRHWRTDDLPLYADLNADPEVMEFLGSTLTRDQSDWMAAWANYKFGTQRNGLLAIERRVDGVFLGMCGVHHLEWYPDDIEIGWRLARGQWGNGYATEAAAAWLDYAFDVLTPSRVISVTDVPNVRSRAVMERLGMTLDHETIIHEGDESFAAVIYAITPDAWRAARGRYFGP